MINGYTHMGYYKGFMRALNLIAVILLLLAAACSSISAGNSTNTNIAKVKVTSEGKLFLNGQETTLDAIKQEFARLKMVNGMVWYYRENPGGEPHPNAMEVIKAVVDAKLPIKLSETDFK
jgi:hypothetical protein